jgi:hypothetical protein
MSAVAAAAAATFVVAAPRSPTASSPRLVAAGAGMAAMPVVGGGLAGQDGDPLGGGCIDTCAGKGGTSVSGGAGGFCFEGCEGLPGELGIGGRGTGCAASGGGGGGGYYGGGGGGHCSAGGGSSRADFPGNTNASTTSAVQSGDGVITFTFRRPL